MYITRVGIHNIRSIKNLIWEIDQANAPGWHVILGDNGSGKSTLVRSLALSYMGILASLSLGQNWVDWVNSDVVKELQDRTDWKNLIESTDVNENLWKPAKIQTDLVIDPVFDDDEYTNDNIFSRTIYFVIGYGDSEELLFTITGSTSAGSTFKLPSLDSNDIAVRLRDNWEGKKGWFSASYGPLRRFTGGDSEESKLLASRPKIGRHLTAFSDRVALTEGLQWLQHRRFQSLEGNTDADKLLKNILAFVNQNGFLPNGAQLTQITSSGVYIKDGNGSEMLAEEMSDGYRSVLSLTFELLRQLSISYGPDIFETHPDGKVTVKVPGVVQIDEVDAHLHPTWQKRIGFWFREHFPAMQFIVTTHSPLVCQAAEKGSIFLLPRPGTDGTGRMLEGAEKNRLLYGDILDAYSTEAFGGGETRSPHGQEKLDRLAELNVKEMLQDLDDAERKEQEELRAALPTSATAVP